MGKSGYGSKLNHQELDLRFESLVPLDRVPFWAPIFDPQPSNDLSADVCQFLARPLPGRHLHYAVEFLAACCGNRHTLAVPAEQPEDA